MAKPTQKTLNAITTLGCLLPMCLWPVLIAITKQGSYMTFSRHSAEPLNAVGTISLQLTVALSVGGAIMVLFGRRELAIRFWALVVVAFNYLFLFNFITANTAVSV